MTQTIVGCVSWSKIKGMDIQPKSAIIHLGNNLGIPREKKSNYMKAMPERERFTADIAPNLSWIRYENAKHLTGRIRVCMSKPPWVACYLITTKLTSYFKIINTHQQQHDNRKTTTTKTAYHFCLQIQFTSEKFHSNKSYMHAVSSFRSARTSHNVR